MKDVVKWVQSRDCSYPSLLQLFDKPLDRLFKKELCGCLQSIFGSSKVNQLTWLSQS